jgi:hypothetical protein
MAIIRPMFLPLASLECRAAAPEGALLGRVSAAVNRTSPFGLDVLAKEHGRSRYGSHSSVVALHEPPQHDESTRHALPAGRHSHVPEPPQMWEQQSVPPLLHAAPFARQGSQVPPDPQAFEQQSSSAAHAPPSGTQHARARPEACPLLHSVPGQHESSGNTPMKEPHGSPSASQQLPSGRHWSPGLHRQGGAHDVEMQWVEPGLGMMTEGPQHGRNEPPPHAVHSYGSPAGTQLKLSPAGGSGTSQVSGGSTT